MAFRMLGFPVRIEASFFVLAAVLGLGGRYGLESLLIWVGIVVVSVLWHELGHAVAFRAFGFEPSIQLFALGGVTSAAVGENLKPSRSLVISASGPAVGLVLGGIVAAFERSGSYLLENDLVRQASSDLVFANVAWGLFNLLPMLPLDGGGVMAALFNLLSRGRGDRAARYVSIVVGVAIGLAGLRFGQPFAAMLAIFFCASNFAALKDTQVHDEVGALQSERWLEEGFEALEQRSLVASGEAAEKVLSSSSDDSTRIAAAHLLFWTSVLQGEMVKATGPARALALREPVLHPKAAAALGGAGEALRLLRTAVEHEAPEELRLLFARVLVECGYLQEAMDVAGEEPHPKLAYDLARGWAREGATDKALAWLGRAVDHGYRDLALLDTDPDLAPIRSSESFRVLRSRVAATVAGDGGER